MFWAGNSNFKSTINKMKIILDWWKSNRGSSILKGIEWGILIVALFLVFGLCYLYLFDYPSPNINQAFVKLLEEMDANLFWYFLIGFSAQMIDGALGMAYGVSVTTFLLGLGIPGITPAIASASMHASEIFTTGSSSLVYLKYRNVNKKLFRVLVWPGLIGTVLGVITVTSISKQYFSIVKPVVAIYTLMLGVLIIKKAIKRHKRRSKIKRIYPVAFCGGFLDSVGGGGWGPIVTSSLIAGGRHLRYTIGSAHAAKFFVAIVSTISFSLIIGVSHWKIIIGLIIGGTIAAPISIYLANKINIKKGLLFVGILIILISLKTLITSLI